MSAEVAGAILMTGLCLFVAVFGGILFWYGFTQPCTVCQDIKAGQKCWHCGATKQQPEGDHTHA